MTDYSAPSRFQSSFQTDDAHQTGQGSEERLHNQGRLRDLLSYSQTIEGYPEGTADAILALSDPPAFTVCPNPFIAELVERTSNDSSSLEHEYHRTSFSRDVSHGKSDPIYRAHSYHTKVPHQLVMHYILHYTNPGDLVLDGFAGTGMTGVATQLCGDRKTVESIGYLVSDKGEIRNTEGEVISHLGARNAILGDLSPFCSFVSSCYTSLPGDPQFLSEAMNAISRAEAQVDWLYTTETGRVLNTVWTDIFQCPNCTTEISYWDSAVREDKVRTPFHCPSCGVKVNKTGSQASGVLELIRSFETSIDYVSGTVVRLPKQVPVFEVVETPNGRQRMPVSETGLIERLRLLQDADWPPVPLTEFFPGRQTNKLINGTGIRAIRHMYTPRALYAYATLWQEQLSTPKYTRMFRFCLTAINHYISKKQGYFGGGGGVSGTLFAPSVHLERNVFDVLRRKVRSVASLSVDRGGEVIVTTQSSTDLRNVPSASVDFIFTDPPFGEPLQYAELNLFAEAWLGVYTDSHEDMVINYVHEKDLDDYAEMMTKALQEYSRVLKPGRWITIVFHNSSNAVWNAIQTAIVSAGLVVADARILDKQQQSFNAVNRANAVDQDLVIAAYRPSVTVEAAVKAQSASSDTVWRFVQEYLRNLPPIVRHGVVIEHVPERQARLLYDRMIAFHIQRGADIPLSASDFYAELANRFPERDGYFFLPDQVVAYDRSKLEYEAVSQLPLVVTDEESAIQWLRQHLSDKPLTYQDLYVDFLQVLNQSRFEKLPELAEILEQNFLQDNQERWYVPDPRRQSDLERLRERTLLREFETYTNGRGQLRTFRSEAVRVGFKAAWMDRDYRKIVDVANRLPVTVLQEDPQLLMFYDNALARVGQ